MLREDLKDAAYIIHNILHQPLDVPDSDSEITLFKAAMNFKIEEGKDSDLSLVLHNFTQHQAPLEMLIREITFIMKDLEN